MNPSIPLTAYEQQELQRHMSLQMQQVGAPLFIDDVPGHLMKLVNTMRTVMVMADRLTGAGSVRAAGQAEAMSQASVMLLAMARNVADGLAAIADAEGGV